MKLTVIIPFKNGEKYAKRFAEGINFQTVDKNLYEVIFVSNRSDDRTEIILRDTLDSNINYRIEKYNEKASSYASRNYGACHSNSEVLVFTDIDCKLNHNYLSNVIEIFDKTEEEAISGKVVLEIEDRKNYWEIYDATTNLNNEDMAKQNHLVTANFAIRKSLFDSVGFFDEFVSNGDSMYGERITKSGKKFVYHENVSVLHPTRKNYEEVKKKLLRMAYGQGQTYRKNGKGIILGTIIYSFKAFNFINLIRLRKRMKKYISFGSFIIFALKFTGIRIQQVKAFRNGYKEEKLDSYNK